LACADAVATSISFESNFSICENKKWMSDLLFTGVILV
jgi:hypothetical protein